MLHITEFFFLSILVRSFYLTSLKLYGENIFFILYWFNYGFFSTKWQFISFFISCFILTKDFSRDILFLITTGYEKLKYQFKTTLENHCCTTSTYKSIYVEVKKNCK